MENGFLKFIIFKLCHKAFDDYNVILYKYATYIHCHSDPLPYKMKLYSRDHFIIILLLSETNRKI